MQKINQEINNQILEFRREIERGQDLTHKKIGDSTGIMRNQGGQTTIEDKKMSITKTIEETTSIAIMIDTIEKEVIGEIEIETEIKKATEERIKLINVIEDLDLDHDRQGEIPIEIINEIN